MLIFLDIRGWFGFFWIGGADALVLALHITFLCLITFWEVFVHGFDVDPWPGIIISCSNGVGTYFFSSKSCGHFIICNRLLGGWKFKYMRDGLVGIWALNQKCISVNILDIFLQNNVL